MKKEEKRKRNQKIGQGQIIEDLLGPIYPCNWGRILTPNEEFVFPLKERHKSETKLHKISLKGIRE